jgi:dolichyl-diphosphooligosaccharide--protein glycosyltransferase
MRRINPKILIAIAIFLFFAVAFCLRVFLPYDVVFGSDTVRFTSGDAYYHMRLADNLVFNFPTHTGVDPFFKFGDAIPVTIRFFGWLIAISSWIVGLGSPTQHTVDLVGAYLPTILAALTVIPVYFIGKELFGRWAGIIAAGVLAILPGEFMGRSILGFTDYDILNTLLNVTAVLFLILAIRSARLNGFRWHHLFHYDRAVVTKPLVFSILAGVFMGLYIFTWLGALLFVFIFSLFFIIQSVIDHLRGRSSDYLGFTGGIMFAAVLVLSPMLLVSKLYFVSILVAFLIPPALSVISFLVRKYSLKPLFYPLIVVVAGAAGAGALYLIDSSMVKAMLEAFNIFTPAGAQLTTIEMQSMFKPHTPGRASRLPPSGIYYFQTSFLAFAGLLIRRYCSRAPRQAGDNPFPGLESGPACCLLGTAALRLLFRRDVALLSGFVSGPRLLLRENGGGFYSRYRGPLCLAPGAGTSPISATFPLRSSRRRGREPVTRYSESPTMPARSRYVRPTGN